MAGAGTFWRLAGKSSATPHPLWAPLHLLLHQDIYIEAILAPDRQEGVRMETVGSGWRERPKRDREERKGQEQGKERGEESGEKGKEGKDNRGGGEDGLGPFCQGVLACEPSGTCIYTCAHRRAPTNPHICTGLNPASAGVVTLGWGPGLEAVGGCL